MSRDARAEKVAEVICRRDDSMYHHDRTDGFPCTDCRETAVAVLDALADDAQAKVERVEALAAHWELVVRLEAFPRDFRFHMAVRVDELRAALNPEPTP